MMADTEKALRDLEPCREGEQLVLGAGSAKNILACVERGQIFEERFNGLDEIKIPIPSSFGYKAMFVEPK